MAVQYIVEGGRSLSGTITPSGNKNAALPIIAAALLSPEPVRLENVPRIRDTETLVELVRSLGASAPVVLGNHDLHLIALAMGNPRRHDPELKEVLAAPDAAELVEWLRTRPLVHYRPELNTLMVHAGVPPSWDPLTTVKLAREVESVIGGPRCRAFMQAIYGNVPDRWQPGLEGFDASVQGCVNTFGSSMR